MIGSVLDNFLTKVKQHTDSNTIVVALSGGVDSVALLYFLKQNLPENYKLKAVHINHQISQYANDWEGFCRSLCNELKISYTATSLHLEKKNRQSLEAIAREQRYLSLSNILLTDEVLVTAHHQDDLAETFLLQALRGAGPKGLSAIKDVVTINNMLVFRPLLSCKKIELLDYAKLHNLAWVEDDSNTELKYQRNFLRHEIMPKLKNIKDLNGLSKSLARSAKLCERAEQLCQELALLDFNACKIESRLLNLNKIKELSLARASNLLRYWLDQEKLRAPSMAKLEEFYRQCCTCSTNKFPELALKDLQQHYFKVYDNKIYLIKKIEESSNDIDKGKVFSLKDNGKIILAADNYLEYKKYTAEEYASMQELQKKSVVILSKKEVKIKYNIFNEKIVTKEYGRLTIKDYFRQKKVIPSLRTEIPIILDMDKIVSIAGLVSIHKKEAVKKNNEFFYYSFNWCFEYVNLIKL